MADLHAALKTTIIANHADGGVNYIQVRLQNGKDAFTETLHARPNTWSTAGFQTTDLLSLIGFQRSACAFHNSECYCRVVPESIDLRELASAIARAFQIVKAATNHLENCGLFVRQPEGWDFFYGKPSRGRHISSSSCRGDGHTSPKVERMKQSEDDFFRFIFTWVEGGTDKGWTTHYRPKHMPISDELKSVMTFIGGFKSFDSCPEYDFEECWWRFLPFESRGDGIFDSNAEVAHRWFDCHATNFAEGIKGMLEAHALLEPWGLTFLAKPTPSSRISFSAGPVVAAVSGSKPKYSYDAAFSFAGTERAVAEEIATIVRNAGFNVFYDNFYPEQLWGRDLVATFDRIYRKDSRYCVMFLSREYADRMWTTLERRSATDRAIQERGNAYILPVKIEDVDIDGLSPSIGYISIAEKTPQQIAEMLIAKLRT